MRHPLALLLLATALATMACAPGARPAPTAIGQTGGTGYVAPGALRSAGPLAAGGKLVGKSKIPEGLLAASAGALVMKGAAIISNGGATAPVGMVPAAGPSSQATMGLVPQGSGLALPPPAAGQAAPGLAGWPAPRFGLLAEGQKPLSGFTVRILDAGFKPVLDGAGKPYEATTATDGTYAFPTTPVGKNLLLALDLPGSLGRALAFLPAPAGVGTRNVDLEGVGTHVLGYVLEQAVRGDQARLERLTPEAEAGARADAEAALAAVAKGRIEADTLATASLVKTVGVWRGLSQPFDRRIGAIEALVDGKPLPAAAASSAASSAPSSVPSSAPSSASGALPSARPGATTSARP